MLTFSAIIYNKGKRSKDSEVAEMTVELKDLASGEEVRLSPGGGGGGQFRRRGETGPVIERASGPPVDYGNRLEVVVNRHGLGFARDFSQLQD